MAKAPVPGKDKLQESVADAEWWDARLDAIGKSRSQISAEFDPGSRNWLQKILTNERRCQIPEAIWLAERIGVPFSEVVSRLGFKAPGASVRVVAAVLGNSRLDMIAPAKQYAVPAPAGVRERTVAAICETGTAPALIYAGALFFYSPTEQPRVIPGALGRLSVLEIGEVAAPVVGTLGRGSDPSSARVTLLDGVTTLDTSQLGAAYPIEWVRMI